MTAIMRHNLCHAALAFVIFCAGITVAQTYHVADKFQIHSRGAWDYVIFDQAKHRLYVPHGTKVEVLDPANGTLLGVIQDTPGVHGMAIVPDTNIAFVTNGHAGTVSVIDLSTLRHLQEIPAGKDPDSIFYEPFTKRLFVSNGDSDDITVIDPDKRAAITTFAASGAPEAAISDGNGKMWVNLEDKNAIAEIDVHEMHTGPKTALAGCSQPTSIAMDTSVRRIFIGCRNSVLVVYDPDAKRVVTKLPIGTHVDGTIYDPESHLIFVASGDGLLTIYKQTDRGGYIHLQTLKTARGAKTIAFDSATGTLYSPTMENVPAPSFGPPRASGPMAYPPRELEVLVIRR